MHVRWSVAGCVNIKGRELFETVTQEDSTGQELQLDCLERTGEGGGGVGWHWQGLWLEGSGSLLIKDLRVTHRLSVASTGIKPTCDNVVWCTKSHVETDLSYMGEYEHALSMRR